MSSQVEIYQSKDGETQIEVRFDEETVWLDQYQLSELFKTDRTSILKHIQNVYSTGELEEAATCAKIAQVRQEGKRKVKRQILHYNLDVIISVGYRVNSISGTQFRQWATQRLKDYLVKGYAINQKRLEQTRQDVRILKSGIEILSRALEDKARETGLEWLEHYAKGLELLDDYDHERLDAKGLTERAAKYPARADYQKLIEEMKAEFDSAVFGREKDNSFDSAIAQIAKGYGDEDFYPSLEEKAAMLLYLVVKNHAFADGNKRIAAACFLYFLKENELLYTQNQQPIISNEALASLTLFVAASKPEEMETVKKLIISVLNRNQ